MSIVAQMNQVSFSYGTTEVLQDITLSISKDDFLIVAGSNGGGKTTLLKLLLGLLTPTKGTVELLGETPQKAAFRTGYVPQRAKVRTGFPLTVMDVVKMGRLRPGHMWFGYVAEDTQRARLALETVQMETFQNRRFDLLSGGQQQRTLIARALVDSPELLLLDEPAANIDASMKAGIYNLLDEISRDIPIICVSHDLTMLPRKATGVICVDKTVHSHAVSSIPEDLVEPSKCHLEYVLHPHTCPECQGQTEGRIL